MHNNSLDQSNLPPKNFVCPVKKKIDENRAFECFKCKRNSNTDILYEKGDVLIGRLIGEGGFGEVYCGARKGKPCAFKTIKKFNPEFRKTLEAFLNDCGIVAAKRAKNNSSDQLIWEKVMQVLTNPDVYEAAIKKQEWSILEGILDTMLGRARFKEEYPIMDSLTHVHGVVQLLGGPLEVEDKNWFSMEFLTLPNLEEKLDEFNLKGRFNVASKLLGRVAELHKNKVIHHDINPRNVFLEDLVDGINVKLGDFGNAHQIGSGIALSHAAILTRIRQIRGEDDVFRPRFMGTEGYIAPEVYGGDRTNPQSDQYAVAVVIYKMFGSGLPFSSYGKKEYKKVSDEDFTIPEQLDAVLEKALSEKPSRRYKDMKTFKKEFELAMSCQGDEKCQLYNLADGLCSWVRVNKENSTLYDWAMKSPESLQYELGRLSKTLKEQETKYKDFIREKLKFPDSSFGTVACSGDVESGLTELPCYQLIVDMTFNLLESIVELEVAELKKQGTFDNISDQVREINELMNPRIDSVKIELPESIHSKHEFIAKVQITGVGLPNSDSLKWTRVIVKKGSEVIIEEFPILSHADGIWEGELLLTLIDKGSYSIRAQAEIGHDAFGNPKEFEVGDSAEELWEAGSRFEAIYLQPNNKEWLDIIVRAHDSSSTERIGFVNFLSNLVQNNPEADNALLALAKCKFGKEYVIEPRQEIIYSGLKTYDFSAVNSGFIYLAQTGNDEYVCSHVSGVSSISQSIVVGKRQECDLLIEQFEKGKEPNDGIYTIEHSFPDGDSHTAVSTIWNSGSIRYIPFQNSFDINDRVGSLSPIALIKVNGKSHVACLPISLFETWVIQPQSDPLPSNMILINKFEYERQTFNCYVRLLKDSAITVRRMTKFNTLLWLALKAKFGAFYVKVGDE